MYILISGGSNGDSFQGLKPRFLMGFIHYDQYCYYFTSWHSTKFCRTRLWIMEWIPDFPHNKIDEITWRNGGSDTTPPHHLTFNESRDEISMTFQDVVVYVMVSDLEFRFHVWVRRGNCGSIPSISKLSIANRCDECVVNVIEFQFRTEYGNDSRKSFDLIFAIKIIFYFLLADFVGGCSNYENPVALPFDHSIIPDKVRHSSRN